MSGVPTFSFDLKTTANDDAEMAEAAGSSSGSAQKSDEQKAIEVKTQVYQSFLKGGMSEADAQHLALTMPQSLIDSANAEAASNASDTGDEEEDEGEELDNETFLNSLTEADCVEWDYCEGATVLHPRQHQRHLLTHAPALRRAPAVHHGPADQRAPGAVPHARPVGRRREPAGAGARRPARDARSERG